MEMDAEQDDRDENEAKVLSTHEKELQKMQLPIEQMEKANLEPKSWTMQGEVTAAKRPKNSALEADLDFEHRTRPAPVIKKRIMENHFDDVQRTPVLPYKAPKEHKELLWDLTAGKLLHDFKFHNGHIRCINFHPHEFLLATDELSMTRTEADDIIEVQTPVLF